MANISSPLGGQQLSNQLGENLGSVKNLVNSVLDAKSSNADQFPSAPWFDPNNQVQNSFMPPIQIDGKRWDELYPYRLLVVEEKADGSYAPVASNAPQNSSPKVEALIGAWRIQFTPMANVWAYTLPITPQQLSISSVFTTVTSPTQTGIVEEHNGVKFKMITAQGSFGVWPNRSTKAPQPTTGLQNAINTLFGGVIQQAGQLVNQFNRTIRTATSEHPEASPISPKPPETGAGYQGTGYAQALLMDQFLEQYAELKKLSKNKKWRLALDIPKQNQTFLVSPVQFAYFQSADSPNEYKFNLQLKAWKRIVLQEGSQAQPNEIQGAKLTPNVVRRILNTVTESRRTLSAVYSVIGAVNSDVTSIFNSIGEVATLLKQIIGLPVAVTDLPVQIKNNFKTQISDAFNTLPDAIDAAFKKTTSNWKQIFPENQKQLEGQGFAVSQVSFAAINGGSFQVSGGTNTSEDPSIPQSLGLNQDENDVEVTDNIPVDSLNLSPQAQSQIQAYLDSALLLTTQDIIQILNQISNLQFQLSNLFNAGNNTYNQIYGNPPRSERGYQTTIDEYLILKSLYDLIQQLQTLTATDQLNKTESNSAIDFVQALARQNNIPFDNQISMIRAPVPFGLTIEQIAARYLGNPDRWIEIATLNALKEPYIDETGFSYPLLSNAFGRQFNIATKENLYFGQKLIISATGQPNIVRRIIDIEQISANNYLITVDGEANLDPYTLLGNASVKGYLAGTVNSQNLIFIPSGIPVPEDLAIRPIPVAEDDPLTNLSDVDLLLTDNYDIAIDQAGDFKLAFGMQNLIQALKIKLITVKGTLIKHPDFGAGVSVGSSSADTTSSEILNSIVNTVLQDDRFSGVEKVQVDIRPPSVNISLAVRLANGNGVFPLTFSLS